MADNVDAKTATNVPVATDVVTYSGDAGQSVQLMRPVHVTGSEGSKTVVDLILLEDAAHTTGDPGFQVFGVRNDANAARTSTDGDYGSISIDSAGNVNVMARRGLVPISVQSGGLTTATTAYTAGDQVGTQFTFAGAARASGGGGTIVAALLIDAADIIGAYDLVVTDSSITLASDNAAYAISDSDALKLVSVPIQLAGSFDIGNNRVAGATNLSIPYACSGGTSLYGGLICRVGHTFFAATTNLQVILFVELN